MIGMSRVRLIATVFLVLGATAAAAQPPRWTLRAHALVSDYEHEFIYPYFTTSYLTVDDGRGFEGSVEYRPRPRLGFELAVGQLTFDAHERVTQLQPISFNPTVLREVTIFSADGEFTVKPLTAGLLFHPLRDGRFDLYVGPQLAWVRYDIDVSERREPYWGYGGKVGAAYVFGRSPWSIGVEYRHLELLRRGEPRPQPLRRDRSRRGRAHLRLPLRVDPLRRCALAPARFASVRFRSPGLPAAAAVGCRRMLG